MKYRKENHWKTNNRADIIKQFTVHVIRVPEEEERKEGTNLF